LNGATAGTLNLNLLKKKLPDDPQTSRFIEGAIQGAERGAVLTKRLLAFARRQILDPVVVDANRQLSGLTELMQRTLGESVENMVIRSNYDVSTKDYIALPAENQEFRAIIDRVLVAQANAASAI